MKVKKNLFLTGHNGLVGSSILRILKKTKKFNIITISRSKLDLRDYTKLDKFLKKKN